MQAGVARRPGRETQNVEGAGGRELPEPTTQQVAVSLGEAAQRIERVAQDLKASSRE